MLIKYYANVLRDGWASYKRRIRGGKREVIAFLMQTSFVLALLYFAPWFGRVQDEARLVAAAVAAVLLTSFLTLLWEIIKAPAVEQEKSVEEITRLSGALGFLDDLGAVRSQGRELLDRWEDARGRADFSIIAQIEKDVDRYISNHFTASDLLSYRYGEIMLVEPATKDSPEYYEQSYRRFIDRLTYGQLIIENKIYHFKAGKNEQH